MNNNHPLRTSIPHRFGQALVLLTSVLLGLGGGAANAQLSVSDGGQASYNYGIGVPPGISGMQPKLALSYSGGAGAGPVGYGWSVQGVSMITRCPANKVTDGQRGAVNYDGNDKLCLDGQRLIPTDANGAAPVTGIATGDALGLSGTAVREYRVEKDTYSRIRAYGAVSDNTANLGNGPKYFKVWTKSGQIFEYGATPSVAAANNTLITPQDKTQAMVWAVARVSDTVGNYMDFKYEVRSVAWGTGPNGVARTGKEWNLSEVAYTGNSVLSQAPRNRVSFVYTDRADGNGDRSETYHKDSKNLNILRLASITTYVDAIPVRSLIPGYANGATTGRSVLQTLKECAGGPTSTKCLPPSSFSYSAGSVNFTPSTGFANNAQGQSNGLSTLQMLSTTADKGVINGDFNGDGKTDILRWSNTPSENKLYLSEGTGNFRLASNFNITDENLFKGDATTLRTDLCFMSIASDFNGDGLTDILRYASPNGVDANNGNTCPTGKTSYLYLSNGDGTFQKTTLQVNGSQAQITLARSQGTIVYNYGVTPWTAQISNRSDFISADFNGDGILDLMLQTTGVGASFLNGDYFRAWCAVGSTTCGAAVYLGGSNGQFTLASPTVFNGSPGAGSSSTRWTPDLWTLQEDSARAIYDHNGDGMTDIVSKGSWGGALLSTGNGDFTYSTLPADCIGTSLLGDINGDGRDDILCAQLMVENAPHAIYTSTGTGFSWQMSSGSPNVMPYGIQPNLLDLDGDGRSDFLQWSDTPSLTKFYRSRGDGTFAEVTTNLRDHQLRKSDGTADYLVGDFSGSGATEFLLISTNPTVTPNKLLVKADPLPADLLLSMTSPNGAVSSITYAPLHNSSRYASDRGTTSKAVYPLTDVVAPMFIATALTTDTGRGGPGSSTTSTQYAYRGLKADGQGRGMLGFREVRQQSQGPDGSALTNVTRYLQVDPYIGMPSRSETWLGALAPANVNQGGQLLSYTDNTYCDMTRSATPTDTAAADAAQPTTPCAVAQTTKIQYPYLRKSVQGGADLSGSSLPTTTTVTTYNLYNAANGAGDPKTIVATTTGAGPTGVGTQTVVKTTTNTYLADDISGDRWIRGRLTRSVVNSSVPNSLAALGTGAGTAPSATATTGDLSKAPLTAVMSAILSLLLGD